MKHEIKLEKRTEGEREAYIEGYKAGREKGKREKQTIDYKTLWYQLYSYINDFQFAIAPDDTMENDVDKYVRIEECDILQQILDTMIEMVAKEEENND